MKLLLIRHAEMTGDPFVCPEQPVSGCLSEEIGVPQAEATREALRHVKIDIAFSSPFGRALQTAEIVLGPHSIPIKVLPFMHEWLPNPKLEEVSAEEREAIEAEAAALHLDEMWKTELGEGAYEVLNRVGPPFLKKLSAIGVHRRHGGYVLDAGAENLTIAVFAHGGSLGTLYTFLMGFPARPMGYVSFHLTGIACLNFMERQGVYYPRLEIPALHPIGQPEGSVFYGGK
jgi:broad specificity phosphatase PhoE